MLYVKAGAANMAGAYGSYTGRCVVYTDRRQLNSLKRASELKHAAITLAADARTDIPIVLLQAISVQIHGYSTVSCSGEN